MPASRALYSAKENRKDVEEIKDYLRGLDFIYVREITEVIDVALTNTKVERPIDLMKLVLKSVSRNSTYKPRRLPNTSSANAHH